MRKIAFVTAQDPLDKRSWSGTIFRMYNALCSEFEEVTPIGPIKFRFPEFILRGWLFFLKTVFKKRYLRTHNRLLSILYAIMIKKRIKNKNFDALFVPCGSTLIANLKTNIPIFYYSDATVHGMLDYYEVFSNLINFSKIEANRIEQNAIQNSRASIFSSKWAAKDAVPFYNADPKRIHIIKMGANISSIPPMPNLERKTHDKICNLLFLGVEWKRKGGDIAYDAFLTLRNMGFNAQLTVCGCIPPVNHKDMTVYPFLNKNNPKDYQVFEEILKKAHFLLLPTRAECSAIAFCEACANGIPSITTDTGGVSDYIENGKNGYTLPISATAHDYADIINNTFNNPVKYKELSINARRKYLNELNWEIWAKEIKRVIISSPPLPGEIMD